MMILKGALLINSQMLCLSPQYHLLELRGRQRQQSTQSFWVPKGWKRGEKIISVILVCSIGYRQLEKRVRIKRF